METGKIGEVTDGVFTKVNIHIIECDCETPNPVEHIAETVCSVRVIPELSITTILSGFVSRV